MENNYCIIMAGGIGSRFGRLVEITVQNNFSIFLEQGVPFYR